MSLVADVNAAITAAMKARDQARLVPLRMLKTALTMREVEKGRTLEPAEDLQVVNSLIKQRRDAIALFEKGGRADLVEKETREIVVLQGFLPAGPDAAEVAAVIDETVRELGASGAKDFGRVMKAAMAKLAPRGVDGKTVSDAVKARLG